MIYKYNNKTHFKNSRDKIIIDLCKGKKVLHIGATDSPYTKEKYQNNLLLHIKIQNCAKDVLGIDIDKESISYLKTKGVEDIIEFNMNNIKSIDFEPDVIIFGETIEHLMNQEIALETLKGAMNQNTQLVLSTPNSMWLNNIINTFAYRERQHPDHKIVFSYATLNNLLIANNFTIKNVYFTFLDRQKEGISKHLKKLFCSLFKGFSETIVYVVEKQKI